MDLAFYLTATAAIMITGISKSGFAGGLGVLAVPMMALFIAPQQAVVILIPLLLAMDAANIWRYRHDWAGRVVAVLLPGAVIGIGLGGLSFEALSPDLLKAAVGAMALLFAGQFVLGRRARGGRPNALTAFLVSVFSGYAGTVALAGGPPIKGYLLRACPEKSTYVGTNSVFFAVSNVLKALVYASLGQYSVEAAWISLSLTPALVAGVWIGFRLHHVVRQETFLRLSYVLLALAGVRLLWDAFF